MQESRNGNIILRSFSFLETFLPTLAMFGIASLVAIEAILRYGFNTSILGMEEVAIIIGLYCYLLGSACSSRDNNHIKVNLLDDVPLSKNTRKVFSIISGIVSVIVTGIFFYISLKYGISVKASGMKVVPLGISKLFQVLPLILGFGIMFIHEIIWLYINTFKGNNSVELHNDEQKEN